MSTTKANKKSSKSSLEKVLDVVGKTTSTTIVLRVGVCDKENARCLAEKANLIRINGCLAVKHEKKDTEKVLEGISYLRNLYWQSELRYMDRSLGEIVNENYGHYLTSVLAWRYNLAGLIVCMFALQFVLELTNFFSDVNLRC